MTDLVPGFCKHPIGHTGRCADGLGRSWRNNHPDCEGCVTRERWARMAMDRADRDERDLDRIRAALPVLLVDPVLLESDGAELLRLRSVLAALPDDGWTPEHHDVLEAEQRAAREALEAR